MLKPLSRKQLLLMVPFFLCQLALFAQSQDPFRLRLRNGDLAAGTNLPAINLSNNSRLVTAGNYYTIVQFRQIPTDAAKASLAAAGMELLDYIPNNAYRASISKSVDSNFYRQWDIRSIIELPPAYKMDTRLVNRNFPAWSVKESGTVDVTIAFPKNLAAQTVIAQLQPMGISIINKNWAAFQLLTIRIDHTKLNTLAALPFIEYVEPASAPVQPLAYNALPSHRSNILNAPLSAGGRALSGNGVVVGIGDQGNITNHADYNERIIDRSAGPYQYHAFHVSGTVAGAGLINPIYKGHADRATVVSQDYENIINNAGNYVQDYGMVVTNNSYGSSAGNCTTEGVYDLISRAVDLQAQQYPFLLHVFAAGNYSGLNCLGYPTSYATVFGGFQSAKNVITVGGTTQDGQINFYSKGPVRDGRLKPEISAISLGTFSTVPFNAYSTNSGTSMAAPQVTGSLALLWERYRQLNGGANPKAGLMKAIVCNAASDLGNAGPDFANGFGWLNGGRAVQQLENNQYFTQTISNGSLNTHTITVPANTAQVKIMLYWPDAPAAANAAVTLVNDLDLSVTTPASSTILPLVLDPAVPNVLNLATNGADHRNNIEQVVINNPATGSYTLRVNGFNIPQGPQEYFIVYEFISNGLTINYPLGSESFVPGENETIQWEAAGNPANNFTVEFSSNNGASWLPVATASASARRVNFPVPAVATNQGKIRITQNGTGLVSESQLFTVLGLPAFSGADISSPCEGSLQLKWQRVSNATDYEVMRKQGAEMISLGTLTDTFFVVTQLSKDSVYWLTVRARIGGVPGRRAPAVGLTPNGTACTLPQFDNDLSLDAITAPVSGRQFTSSALPAAAPVSIRIKNLDDLATSGSFDVSYTINGGAPVIQTISPVIAPNGLYDHTFTIPANLGSFGNYTIAASVTKAGDGISSNNSKTITIKNIANAPITLPFDEGFESGADKSYLQRVLGMDGIERWDLDASDPIGRARTVINSGMARTGNRALTLDARRFSVGIQTYLTGTFNMSSYVANDNVRVDVYYKHHGQKPLAQNKILLRGSESNAWIDAYDLYENQNDAGIYNWIKSIDISDLLATNGQALTNNFQLRFAQGGISAAVDNFNSDGYTFDDIKIYTVTDDIQLLRVVNPGITNCGGSSTGSIAVSVKNSSSATITNIPVSYQLNGGAVITETIPSIAPKTTITYTFSTTANLSTFGAATLNTWCSLASDSYRPNDSVVNYKFYISPIVSSFPFLETFETGDGNWFALGKLSTWEYGDIASAQINKAANGQKGWKTKLSGNYKDNEKSFLYSPCFNINGMTNPTLSFSHAFDLEKDFDYNWVEYSTDNITWQKLGAVGGGTNWYNTATPSPAWTDTLTRWHVATHPLPVTAGTIRLRFAITADLFVNQEGVAIDDVHIFNNLTPVHNTGTIATPITNSVSGSGWTDFVSGGKIVASINPQGQNLGSTNLNVYIFGGPVRNVNNQYYHNRNWVIQPTNAPTGAVKVRLYFLDNETNDLINATGCAACSKPRSAYDLGVTRYSGNPATENGDLGDNSLTNYQFILPADVTIIPYDQGYYAEFEVNGFSEFWLNDGGPGLKPLPVQLKSFTVRKQANNDVLAEWQSAGELNMDYYELEVAKSTAALRQQKFDLLTNIAATGNNGAVTNYRFNDTEAGKSGSRYYRLKLTDKDRKVSYSEIRAVSFNQAFEPIIFPNPTTGRFKVLVQSDPGEIIQVKLMDNSGRVLLQKQITGNGLQENITLDISAPQYPAGVYSVQVQMGKNVVVEKIVKRL
jgi:Subtilase family/Secretion system C-terminal sorting domain